MSFFPASLHIPTFSGCNEVLTETPPVSSNWVFSDDCLCFYGDFSSSHAQFDPQNTDQSSCSMLIPGSTSNSQPNCVPVQEDIFYQPWESNYVQLSNNDIQNARKKDVSKMTMAMKRSAEAVSCSLMNSATNKRDREKKRPARFQGKLSNTKKEKAPKLRRGSQKLTDKITALQKLVSPYGKTDTSSVLLEASLSIKALQDQIEDMFHKISGEEAKSMAGEKRSDLQSRGLCLVPSIILEELDTRLPIYCHYQ